MEIKFLIKFLIKLLLAIINARQCNHCYLLLAQKTFYLGPVHMIPGQLIAPGQLTDNGVNFASVHGLTPVTVHMNFSLPGATSRGGLPIVQQLVTRLAEVAFLHVNRTQTFSWSKSRLAHAQY